MTRSDIQEVRDRCNWDIKAEPVKDIYLNYVSAKDQETIA